METQENKPTTPAPNRLASDDRSGRAFGGIVIVAIGTLLLARKAGVELPSWLFTWQMLVIAIGFYIGARHRFRDWGWLIPVIVGVVFLSDEFIEGISIGQFMWPAIIIVFGLLMIFRPRRNRDHACKRWHERHGTVIAHGTTTEENFLDNVNIFGSSKKVIISKDFKGGDVVTIFGGSEINLTQADVNGRAELELVQVFGGTKLIIPAHWSISTEEMVCVFGGLDDKRDPSRLSGEGGKTLVIRGTCIFGGIDIRSF